MSLDIKSQSADPLPIEPPTEELFGTPKPVDVVLAPAEAFPRIDLRAKGEPWERRRTAGKQLRAKVPYSALNEPVSLDGRPDPLDSIARSNVGRQAHLVPLRIARMAESPFAFLRGAASVMAFDLARAPRSGIDVVMNGDAHISNFGLFGTPQRDVVLDLNDFDEVTIGPWEWDLKRLAASLNVAARQQGIGSDDRRRSIVSCVKGYRRSMFDLAPRGPIDVWHRAARADKLDFDGIEIDAASQGVLKKAVEKARRRDNAALLEKVGERQVDGGWRFRLDPPILTPVDDATREAVISGLEHYAESLPRERRFMLSRYHVVDVVHRVVGVGSVGTRAYLALLFGNSDQDALFLQVKEAVRPAHAPFVAPLPEPYGSHEGARVVYGQRLLQAVGDPLLGWTTIGSRPFYVRQMKNMKGEIPHSLLSARSLVFFAFGYGALLARAHARTGDAAAISGYCGGLENHGLDDALADWAETYGDQNAIDHQALVEAVEQGRVLDGTVSYE